MEIENYSIQILKASEGKYLTQKILSENDVRTFHTMITVTNETKDNYREATLEEKEEHDNLINNINKDVSRMAN